MAKIFYFLGHEQYQPEVLVEHAKFAEKAGFDGVSVSEHFNPWVADKSAAGFAFSTLGAIAVLTKKIELMTGVVTPLFRYHPAVVAQAAATVDRLSNGRFILGVGNGEALNEAALGYDFPSYKERAERMQEALAIMRPLLDGKTVDYKGSYYTTENAHLYSPPLRRVPIFLAAGGPKSVHLASTHADGVIVSVKSVEDTQKKLESIMNKKNFTVAASRWTVFAKNEKEAWQALLPWRGLRAPGRDKITDPRKLQKEADSLPKREVLSRYSIVSNANDYLNVYQPLFELKPDIVIIQTTAVNQEKVIRLLGEEVLPKLHKV